MKRLLCFLVIFCIISCRSQNKSMEFNQFYLDKVKLYDELILFLNSNKVIFEESICHDTILEVGFDMNDVLRKNCYEENIKKRLAFFYSQQLFHIVKFYQDEGIELLLRVENSAILDYERTHYFVYTFSDTLPGLYRTYHYHKRLAPHWWYVMKYDAYF